MRPDVPASRGSARQGRRAPTSAWWTLYLHFALVLLILSMWLSIPSASWVLLCAGLISMPTYLCMAWMESRTAPLRLNPLSFYLAWSSIGLGASAIHMSSQITGDRYVSFATTEVAPQDLVTGYVIYLSGSLLLHLGMHLRSPRPVPANFTITRAITPSVYIIFVLGLLRQGFPAAFARLGTIASHLNYGTVAGLSAFALHPYFRRKLGPVVFWSMLSLGTLVLLLSQLLTGSKAYIMYAFVPVTWLFLLDNSLRRFFPALLTGVAVLYLGVVAPVVGASRLQPLQPGENAAQHILRTLTGHLEGVAFMKSETGLTAEQSNNFLDRMFDPTPVGYFVDQVRQSGLQHGQTMTYIGYAFVPRVLWPSKPDVTRGAWFDAYIGQARTAEEATTSLGMTATGDLYWNFGTLGVLAGMLLIGLMESELWRLAGSDPRSSPIRMLLYVSLTLEIGDMPEAVTFVVGLVSTWLIFQTLLLLTRRREPRAQRFPQGSYAYHPQR